MHIKASCGNVSQITHLVIVHPVKQGIKNSILFNCP